VCKQCEPAQPCALCLQACLCALTQQQSRSSQHVGRGDPGLHSCLFGEGGPGPGRRSVRRSDCQEPLWVLEGCVVLEWCVVLVWGQQAAASLCVGGRGPGRACACSAPPAATAAAWPRAAPVTSAAAVAGFVWRCACQRACTKYLCAAAVACLGLNWEGRLAECLAWLGSTPVLQPQTSVPVLTSVQAGVGALTRPDHHQLLHDCAFPVCLVWCVLVCACWTSCHCRVEELLLGSRRGAWRGRAELLSGEQQHGDGAGAHPRMCGCAAGAGACVREGAAAFFGVHLCPQA